MPRGQYDRTKTKTQRAAEKKAAGKAAMKSAPAVTPHAVKTAAPSPLKKPWKDAPANVQVETAFTKEESPSQYDLRNEMDRVSTILTNVCTNHLTLGNCGNLELLGKFESMAARTLDHLDRLRQLLPHSGGQTEVTLTGRDEVTVSLDAIQTGEKDRIAAEVARRRASEPKASVAPPTFLPTPLPGNGAAPPTFMPLAAPSA
jgi:hypothetical protein